MSIFMENTEIAPERTIGEIEKVLISHGATAVLKECENGEITGVSFKIKTGAGMVPFRLPCRWQAILCLLEERRGRSIWSDKLQESYNAKARRVAWRQILRWVQAQMALVETNMVKVEEVFFPYIQAPNGRTIYEIQADKGLLLGSGQ